MTTHRNRTGQPADARTLLRALGNSPAAASVLVRHLVTGTRHVRALPQPWQTPTYRVAVAALERGDLTAAELLARSAGPAGAVLRQLIAGDIELLIAAHHRTSPRASRNAPEKTGRDSVLHLVTNALPDKVAGYTLRTQGIAKAQVDRGLDVHVATRIGFPVTIGHLSAPASVNVDGVQHHRSLPTHLPLRRDAAMHRDIDLTTRLVASLRPRVLHAHTNHVNAQVALALRERFGTPVVYEVRGFLEETWRSRSAGPYAAATDAYRMARATETQCMRAADAVVTLSEGMRAAIVTRGVDPDKVTVVPNCVDLAVTGQRTHEHVVAPGSTRLTVGTIGTLNAYEGVEVLIEAVGALRRQGRDIDLRVVGDGPERSALEKRAAERGIADATTFTGWVPHDQVVDQYRAIDVFCVPRHDLPVTRLVSPLKPLEAMALGRPVVASDLPPLRELVGSEGSEGPRHGLLVPPGDADALASALARLHDGPGLRQQLGANAHAWVAQTRTWTTAAETYQQIYARIQGGTT